MKREIIESQIIESQFRKVLGCFPTGVTVVTAASGEGEFCGMTIGSFTSISLRPPLVAFMPNRDSSTFAKMRECGCFCVNILSSDQKEACEAFATRNIDGFARFAWRRSPNGAAILDGAVAWVDCTIEQVYPAGDHYIVIGKVEALDENPKHNPLIFLRGGFGQFAPSLSVEISQLQA